MVTTGRSVDSPFRSVFLKATHQRPWGFHTVKLAIVCTRGAQEGCSMPATCASGLWPKLAPLVPIDALLCCTCNSLLPGSTCLLSGAKCMQSDMRGQTAQPADLPISSRKELEVSLLLAVGMCISTFDNRCCRSDFTA